MPKFSVHTVAHNEGHSVLFAPGDEVPEWALGQVGSHVIEVDAPQDGAPEVADTPEVDAPQDGAPDFTTPAPKRATTKRR